MKKYEIIYADPPWRYEHTISKSRSIENNYPTMELEDIKKLDIPSADNCILFLWATAPKLLEALEVMQEWGFNYRTSAVWDKKTLGMGYWFRNQHELLLVGVKGKVSPPPRELRTSSVFLSKRTEHSKKPSYIRELIAKWYKDKSKIELFARPDERIDLWNKNTFDGWDVWGNEASK